jgi:hypothetical protein
VIPVISSHLWLFRDDSIWLNFVLGLPALAYMVYLLYTGVPVMMEIFEERGFLFSSAVLAVTSNYGLVADDYYKKSLAINRSLERDASAIEKEISADIEIDNEQGLIRILFNKGNLENYPEILQLKLQHATHANNDVRVELHHGQSNQYIGYLKTLLPEGKWYFELSGG